MRKIVLVLISTAVLFLTACTGISKDMKQAAKEYEAFIDEYCAYSATLADSTAKDDLLSRYDGDKMREFRDNMDDKMLAMIGKCLNGAERDYAYEVMYRCDEKMEKSKEKLNEALKKYGFIE